MPYCTEQDLITRYGEDELIQLTDMQNVGQMDTDVINASIADADSLIDGYVGAKYPLPINPVPLSLVRIACEITRYYLQKGIVQDDVQKRYDAAVNTLEQIRDGKMTIGITKQGEKPASNNTVQFQTGGKVFSREDNSF